MEGRKSLVWPPSAPACSQVWTVRMMLPLGDWLEREDISMRGQMKTLFQWLHGDGPNLDRKRKKQEQGEK